jgi:hypothetical protein
MITQLEGRVALVLLALILLVQVAAFQAAGATSDVVGGVQRVEVVGDVTVNGKVEADLGHNNGVWTKSCDEAYPGAQCP